MADHSLFTNRRIEFFADTYGVGHGGLEAGCEGVVVVKLFAEDVVEVLCYFGCLVFAAGKVEGLADAVYQLRVLQGCERDFGKGLVEDGVGLGCEAVGAEVFGQYGDICPVLFEEFAAAFVDVYSVEWVPCHLGGDVAVEGFYGYAVAGLGSEAVGCAFELQQSVEVLAVVVVGVVGEVDGAA